MSNIPYNKNETMKMIGNQNVCCMLGKEEFKAIDDIAKARPNSFTSDAAIDIFVYGYIQGKRAERQRRKGGK